MATAAAQANAGRRFGLIPQDHVYRWWPDVKRLVAAACDAGRADMPPDAVLDRLLDGRRQLWLAVDDGTVTAVLVTRIYDGGANRVLQLHHAGGNILSCLEYLPMIEQWGRDHGCNYATIHGRRGWERAMAQHGYSFAAVELEKRL